MASGAADLFVAQTVSLRILYLFLCVFLFIRHERRELVHFFHVTACPTAAWICQQLPEATPLGPATDAHIIHDRDAAHG